GVIFSTSIQIVAVIIPTPHNHFVAAPYSRVVRSFSGYVCDSGRYPTIRIRIVSSAGVQIIAHLETISTPDNHFIATPNCSVGESAIGRVGESSRRPTIRGWIVFSAGVQNVQRAWTAPDDHFIAGPYYGMTRSTIRRAGDVCPRIINASAISNQRNPVVAGGRCHRGTRLDFCSS